MGGCGSKPKTKDADNEPYGASGGAKTAAGKRSAGKTGGGGGTEGELAEQKALIPQQQQQPPVAAERKSSASRHSDSKDNRSSSTAAAAAAAPRPDDVIQVAQPAVQKQRKTSADEPEASRAKKDAQQSAAAAEQTSSEKRRSSSRGPAGDTSTKPADTEQRKSSTSRPPRTAELESPAAVSVSTTAAAAAAGRDGKETRISGKGGAVVDASDVSVTVSGTSKASLSGLPSVAADVKTTSTSLTTKTPTSKTDDKPKTSTPLTNGSSSPEKPIASSRISPERKDETPAAAVVVKTPSREASPIKAVRVSAEASKPVPPERQTDIKSVNPEMQIFEALQKARSSGVKAAAVDGEVAVKTPLKDAESKTITNGEAVSKVEIKTKSVEISSGQIGKPEVKSQPDVSPVAAAAPETKMSTTPVPLARASTEVKGADVVGPVAETTTTTAAAAAAALPRPPSGTASTPAATAATSPAATVSPTATERRSIPRSVVLLSSSQTPASPPAVSTPPSAAPSPPPASTAAVVDESVSQKHAPTVVQQDVVPTVKSEETPKEIAKRRTSAVENADISTTPKSSAEQQQRTSRLPTLATSPTSPTTPLTPASPVVTAVSPTATPRQSITTATSPPPSTTVPAATPATPADSKPKKEPERSAAVTSPVIDGASSGVKDLFLDLSVENRSIASTHHLLAGTRVRFLQMIDAWFSGEKDPPEDASGSGSQRVLAIYGRPGSGKTCLAAEMCRRYAGKHQLAGSHFFHWKSVGLDHNRTVAVLQSLARRMCDQLPGYSDALPDRRTMERFLDAADPSELFDVLISQPLQSIRRPPERRLIVIDAVDECDGADRDLLFQLLNSFELTTPDWLYVIVALRDDNQLVARLDRVRAVELKSDATDAETLADVKRFFKEPMSRRIDRISLDGAQAQLAKNAEGNFLCATFFKDKLDSLPEDKKLAIRDLTLSFPVGFSEMCRQSFQGLHDRLTKGKKVPPGKESPYQRVVSLLVTALEPLPKSAFGPHVEELSTQMNGTVVTSADGGSVSLSHRAVADWLASEQTPAPLAVQLTAARQTMADAVAVWIGSLGGEQEDGDGGSGTSEKDVDVKLQEYALKHAVYHMTDAAKQQDNLAKLLCSLRFVEKKLKVPGVRLENLLADYKHSHYQTNPGTANLGKLVSLEAAMKRSSGLTEQISLMNSFLVRRGSQLTRLGADFTLHLAANYPTVSRIQENARFDLGTRPWLEDVTAVADTPAEAVRSVRGTIVDVDVSADQRTAAVVTRVDDFGALLYLLNASTGEPTTQEPVDLKSALPDRVGLCVRFIQSSAGCVFFGSLSQFVSVKTGKIVDSGFDLDSVKLTDRYSIECSASGAAGLLAVGVTTLPWGGRSLHAVVFDVATKKCTRTIELLKFRFGGSSQYGVKALGLSGGTDGGSLLCACVKQTNRSELKISVYSTSKGELVASADLDDESPTKCCFFGQQNQLAVLLGPAAHGRADSSKETKRHSSASDVDRSKSFVWSFQQSGSKPASMDRPNLRSLVHASGQQAVLAHRRSVGSSAIISVWKATQIMTPSAPPDKRFVVHGLDEADELIATDKAVFFVAGSQLRLYNFQELPVVDDQFNANDISVDGVSFIPRSDDPLVAFRPSTTASSKISACSLSLRTGDGVGVGTRLFDPTETTSGSGPTLFPECVVGGPEVVAYSADGQCALLNVGYSVRVRDIHSGNQRELPGYGDLLGVPDGDRKVADQENNVGGSILACVVSPKDAVVGVVYGQQPHIIRLFDTKTSKTGKALNELTVPDASSAEAAVTDFCFLSATSSFVVSFHRKLSGGTVVVWNQKTGMAVSREANVDLGYFRSAMGIDRVALSVRSGGGSAADNGNAGVVLRSSDNHLNIRLSTAVTWSPEIGSSDVEFSLDGTVLVGLCSTSFHVWNAANGEMLRSFDVTSSTSAEIVGMTMNAHALIHDVTNERLLLVDVTSGEAVAAVSTDGRVDRKWTARRLRVSPRGGVIAGAAVDGSLRVYACRNMMTSSRRQTTLQMIKTVTSPTKQPLQRQSTS